MELSTTAVSKPVPLWREAVEFYAKHLGAAVGICVLVANAFSSAIREHPGRFLNSFSLFFGTLLIALAVIIIIDNGITTLQIGARLDFPRWEFMVISFVTIALVSAVLVRWIFAVPLVTLHGTSFAKA